MLVFFSGQGAVLLQMEGSWMQDALSLSLSYHHHRHYHHHLDQVRARTFWAKCAAAAALPQRQQEW